MILEKSDSDISLERGEFATLNAVKGRQFGRDVYTSVIRFRDLSNFVEAFPSVQRDIIPRKVSSLRRYIQSGLENGEAMRFFSAVTVSCRGHMFYSDTTHRLAIDINGSKLSINDGQHRVEAIRTLLEWIEKEFIKSKKKERTEKLRGWLDELSEMIIPVVIFDGLSEKEESQLFHDLNNLAQRPSKNANIRLNQTDLFSNMARHIAENNRYMKYYGVEIDKMSIIGGNPNTILLSTIHASVKELLKGERKNTHDDFLNADTYEMYRGICNKTFDSIFFVLPPDLNTKGKYITDKSYTIKAISKFVCYARSKLMLSEEHIFEVISKVDWTYNVDFWSKYGGSKGVGNHSSNENNIIFNGGAKGGFKAVYTALNDIAQVYPIHLKELQGELL